MVDLVFGQHPGSLLYLNMLEKAPKVDWTCSGKHNLEISTLSNLTSQALFFLIPLVVTAKLAFQRLPFKFCRTRLHKGVLEICF